MSEEQTAAKQDMQDSVDGIVSCGAVIYVNPHRSNRSERLYVDRFDILVAKAREGGKGAAGKYYYWAVCYEVDFDRFGQQSIHIFKMDKISVTDTDSLRFTDQHGNSCVLEQVGNDDDTGEYMFHKWQARKERRPDTFERLYEEHNREAMETVSVWEGSWS